MSSSILQTLLGQIAPTIATVLTGGNPLAGMAVKALSNAVLGHPNGSQDDVMEALSSATPEQLLAIKQADNDFQAKMAELGIEPDKLDVEDRASARAMATARGIWPQASMSGLVFVGYFGILSSIMFGVAKVPDNMHDIIVGLLSALSAAVIQVLNFWFGSTHGSQKKDDVLASVATS